MNYDLKKQKTSSNSANRAFSWRESSPSQWPCSHWKSSNENENFLFPCFALSVHSAQFDQWKPRDSSLTSNRFCLAGTSTPQISATFTNWALWWSLRNESTGTTPLGWMSNSSSPNWLTRASCMYLGITSIHIWPNDSSWDRASGIACRIVLATMVRVSECSMLTREILSFVLIQRTEILANPFASWPLLMAEKLHQQRLHRN